jgi:hypothetical protein
VTRATVQETAEIRRIRALPRRTWSDSDLEKLARDLTSLLKTPNGTMHLRPVQALALHDIGVTGGLFGPIRVGGGKTLISLLAPYILESRTPLLLLPAALIKKTEKDLRHLAQHWLIPRNIRMLSYEMLGRVQSASALQLYPPDCIIADEVHRLKNKRAGVTRRVVRYMGEHPETHFIAISGTIMKDSIRNFAHVLTWALKEGAPVPRTSGECDEWGDALDVKINPFRRSDPGALLTL